jgi:hypothetical protein
MSMCDFDRLKLIKANIDGHLKASTATNRLHLTKRQVSRLVERYRADGTAWLISRQRGQSGHRQLTDGMADGLPHQTCPAILSSNSPSI